MKLVVEEVHLINNLTGSIEKRARMSIKLILLNYRIFVVNLILVRKFLSKLGKVYIGTMFHNSAGDIFSPDALDVINFSEYLLSFTRDCIKIVCEKCKYREFCLDALNKAKKVLSDNVEKTVEKITSHGFDSLIYRITKDGKEVRVPFALLLHMHFPIVLLHFLCGDCNNKNCLFSVKFPTDYKISKEDWGKMHDFYYTGVLDLSFLRKYLCEKCWQKIANLFSYPSGLTII